MKINLISDKSSWLNSHIPKFVKQLMILNHEVNWVHDFESLNPAVITLFIGCFKIAKREHLAKASHNLVVHESLLPAGKGWSPMTWQILEGKNRIPVCLFEATEKVDDGLIYLTRDIVFEGHELVEELRLAQAKTTFELCLEFIQTYPVVLKNAKAQIGESSFYRRRTPADSEMNIHKTLDEQFNLLRVVDNLMYPAFFIKDGVKYTLKIEKSELS